jgi:hypothetical protein
MIPDFRPVPTLHELPAPPAGKSGWPWTESCPQLPALAPDGSPWPRISIITPSFNQGRYIEETIRSILLQGYPNLEYIIMDGGSTDETVEIIRKYEPWLSGWVSERDKGQSDAINKGFARIHGDVFNWLCSDDLLTMGSLGKVGTAFLDKSCGVFSGACLCQYDDEPHRSEVRPPGGRNWERTPFTKGIWQPSTFWRPELVKRSELVLRDLHFCMDRELWCHLLSTGSKWCWSDASLSVYRFTGENKSVVGKQKIIAEIARIYTTYVKEPLPLPKLLTSVWLPLVLASEPKSSAITRIPLRLASRLVAAVTMLVYPRERVRGLQKEFYSYSVW